MMKDLNNNSTGEWDRRPLDALLANLKRDIAAAGAKSTAERDTSNEREFEIDTPSGTRVLMDLGGHFALFRPAHNPNQGGDDARKRLICTTLHRRPVRCADGVHIQPLQLATALVALIPAGESRAIDDLEKMLFYDARPGRLWGQLMPVLAAWDDDDPRYQALGEQCWIDGVAGTIYRPENVFDAPMRPVMPAPQADATSAMPTPNAY